jgi:hypothetical protein
MVNWKDKKERKEYHNKYYKKNKEYFREYYKKNKNNFLEKIKYYQFKKLKYSNKNVKKQYEEEKNKLIKQVKDFYKEKIIAAAKIVSNLLSPENPSILLPFYIEKLSDDKNFLFNLYCNKGCLWIKNTGQYLTKNLIFRPEEEFIKDRKSPIVMIIKCKNLSKDIFDEIYKSEQDEPIPFISLWLELLYAQNWYNNYKIYYTSLQ